MPCWSTKWLIPLGARARPTSTVHSDLDTGGCRVTQAGLRLATDSHAATAQAGRALVGGGSGGAVLWLG
jgi:hypothetical protein